MITDELLESYRLRYLARISATEVVVKSTGLSVALILLATGQAPTHAACREGIADLTSALELAVEIDGNQFDALDDQARIIVRELKSHLYENHKTQDFIIANIEDAIRIIQKNPHVSYQAKYVMQVLIAIDQAHRLSDEILAKKNVINLSVPDGKDKSMRFAFHGELYESRLERKNALDRLYLSIISAWNTSVVNNQLNLFLNGFQDGPCVEKATSESLVDVARRQQRELVPLRFRQAMDKYFHQATSLLKNIKFIVMPGNLMSLILAAYNGKSCLSFESDPTIFTVATVEKYINELQFYSNQYLAQEPADKLFFPVNCSIITRLSLIPAIVPYADPEHYAELMMLTYFYNRLLLLNSSKKPINVSEYFGIIKSTNTLNVPLSADCLFLIAVKNNHIALAEALLEFPDLDLLQMNALGLSPLLWLSCTVAGHLILHKLVTNHSTLINAIPLKLWFEPTIRGPYVGLSPFGALATKESGKKILLDLLIQYPQFIKHMSKEILLAKVSLEPSSETLFDVLNDVDDDGNQLLKLLSPNEEVKKIMSADGIAKACIANLNEVYVKNNGDKMGLVKNKILAEMNRFLLKHIHDVDELNALDRCIKKSANKASDDAIGLLKQPRVWLSLDKVAKLSANELHHQTEKTVSFQRLLKLVDEKKSALIAVSDQGLFSYLKLKAY